MCWWDSGFFWLCLPGWGTVSVLPQAGQMWNDVSKSRLGQVQWAVLSPPHPSSEHGCRLHFDVQWKPDFRSVFACSAADPSEQTEAQHSTFTVLLAFYIHCLHQCKSLYYLTSLSLCVCNHVCIRRKCLITLCSSILVLSDEPIDVRVLEGTIYWV